MAKANVVIKYNEHLGDLETFIKKNTKLVWKAVHYYHSKPQLKYLDQEDLFHEGMIGLLRAYYAYDPKLAARHSTYSFVKIKGAIRAYIRDHGHTIHYPRTVQEISLQLLKNADTLNDLTVEKVRQKFQVEHETALASLLLAKSFNDFSCKSLESKIKNEEDSFHLYEIIGEPVNELTFEIREFISLLEEDERQIFQLYYYQGKMQREIGKIVGLSQVSISRKIGIIREKAAKYFLEVI